MKKLLHWTVFLTAQVALLEIVCMVGLSVLERRHLRYQPILADQLSPRVRGELKKLLEEPPGYLRADSELGWTIREGGEAAPLYRANVQGIRGDREYSRQPGAGVVRIAAFGDSFTHASQVANADTWEERLTGRLPNLEVLNFGVGGYALDQAYLRYLRDGAQFAPDIVFIGFMSENIRRSVNVFRPFYSAASAPFSKPRFLLRDGGGVRLLENPLDRRDSYQELLEHPERVLPRLGAHDFYFQRKYRPGRFDRAATVRLAKMARWQLATSGPLGTDFYDPGSEAFQVTSALFDAFHSAAEQRGSTPVILLFPDQFDVAAQWNDRPRAYRSMIEFLQERGYRFIDLLTVFERQPEPRSIEDLFRSLHYSPIGNQLIADHLASYLRQEGLLDPALFERSRTDRDVPLQERSSSAPTTARARPTG
jgi:hypothetical protein